MALTDDQKKQLALAVAGLDKQYGTGTVFLPGAKRPVVDIIPTGNFPINQKLGIGGLPRGRIVEIFGPEGVGKTLLALTTVAQAQKQGGLVAYVDMEHALDPIWAEKLGVIWDDLVFSQPDFGEQAMETVDTLTKTGLFSLIVVDSVAACVPKSVVDAPMEKDHIALLPRLMSQAMSKINPNASNTNTTVLLVNQLREKIGFMQSGTTTPGGRAIKFYSSVRIEMVRTKNLTDTKAGETIGAHIKAKILKNKFARPMVDAEYDVIHGVGFNNVTPVFEIAEKYELLRKSGTYWYQMGSEKPFAQGDRQAMQYVADNPEWFEKLEFEVNEKMKDES